MWNLLTASCADEPCLVATNSNQANTERITEKGMAVSSGGSPRGYGGVYLGASGGYRCRKGGNHRCGYLRLLRCIDLWCGPDNVAPEGIGACARCWQGAETPTKRLVSPKYHLLLKALWIAHPVLQSLVAAAMIRRKLYKAFPFFFAYVVAQILIFAILFPIYKP